MVPLRMSLHVEHVIIFRSLSVESFNRVVTGLSGAYFFGLI